MSMFANYPIVKWIKNHRILILSMALFSAVVLVALEKTKSNETLKIVYIGRDNGINDSVEESERLRQFNLLHEFALRSYIKDFNLKYGKDIELETFYNYKDPDSTFNIYKRITKDSSVIAVIDNSWGAEMRKSEQIIKENGIPVVAINAALNNKMSFGNSVISTTNYDQAVKEIASYINKGLGAKEVNFISSRNHWLHGKFLAALEENNISISDSLFYDVDLVSEDPLTELESDGIVRIFNSRNSLTLLNTSPSVGEAIIQVANERFSNQFFIGHTSVIGGNTVHLTNNNSLIILSQTEKAISSGLSQRIMDFKNNYPSIEKNFNSVFFFKRCKNAWDIIEWSILNSKEKKRESVALNFSALFSKVIETEENLLSFDANGSLVKESTFVKKTETTNTPSLIQINNIGNVVSNLNFGIEIIDLQNIDLESNTFKADFYYWVLHDLSLKETEKYFTFQNIKAFESETQLITSKITDNSYYKLYKVSGTFFSNFNERDYPFDHQEVSIDVQVLNTTDEVRVSYDGEMFISEIDDLKIEGWNQEEFYVTVDNIIADKLKGNAGFSNNFLNEFKKISFRFKVERVKLPGFLQVILPLFFIGILAISLLFVKNLDFGNIGEPLAAVFLTIVAFSISLAEITPTGNVLKKTDYLFILTLITVVSSFLFGLTYNTRYGSNKKVIEIARGGLAVLYALLFLLIILF